MKRRTVQLGFTQNQGAGSAGGFTQNQRTGAASGFTHNQGAGSAGGLAQDQRTGTAGNPEHRGGILYLKGTAIKVGGIFLAITGYLGMIVTLIIGLMLLLGSSPYHFHSHNTAEIEQFSENLSIFYL